MYIDVGNKDILKTRTLGYTFVILHTLLYFRMIRGSHWSSSVAQAITSERSRFAARQEHIQGRRCVMPSHANPFEWDLGELRYNYHVGHSINNTLAQV